MRWLLCLAIAAILALPSWAFRIEAVDQIPNEPPGYCVWASCETLARHHRIERLYGILASYRGTPAGTTYDQAADKLSELGIPFIGRREGKQDHERLRLSCERDIGAVIAVYGYPSRDSYHAIIVVEYDGADLKFVDTNNVGSTYRATRAWLDQSWSGFMLILFPPAKHQWRIMFLPTPRVTEGERLVTRKRMHDAQTPTCPFG